jgi:hypothetical protein
MILHPSELEIQTGDRIHIVFTNEFEININCTNNYCDIVYGFEPLGTNSFKKTIEREDAKQYVEKIISKYVPKSAKLKTIGRSKHKQSMFRSMVETFI